LNITIVSFKLVGHKQINPIEQVCGDGIGDGDTGQEINMRI
jgi:hypothetical protein